MPAIVVLIEDLTLAALQESIREALADESAADTIADLVASVDWSGYERSATSVRAVLGELEAWTTDLAEGQLNADGYRKRLDSLLPAPARA